LPFRHVADLLGVNAGGLTAKQGPVGFVIVIGLMFAIGAIELLYFKRKERLD
jgi:Mg2+ and Co2+ transporter CorA